MKKLCSFKLGYKSFGVDILDIKEISLQVEFSPIPHSPEEVRGLVNLRGEIYLVLDLGVIFSEPPLELNSNARLLLFKDDVSTKCGILVHSVGDVIEVDEGAIEERRK